MQTYTTLELKLEDARLACEETLHKLHGRLLANWLLSEYYDYFQNKLEYLLELLDEILGLIATLQTPLRRTEMLSSALMEDGLRAQTISLIQTSSNQADIARELSNIWQNDEEKMIQIEDSLCEFNQSLRELQRVREQADTKWLMNMIGFPTSDSMPHTLSLQLLKELFDPDVQLHTEHTIIEVPPQRFAIHNPSEASSRLFRRPRSRLR